MASGAAARTAAGRPRSGRRSARLALALLALALVAADADSWSRVRPDGEDFSVAVPAPPTRSEQSFETPAGPRTSVFHSAHRGDQSFTVVYTRYGEEFVQKVDGERLVGAAELKLLRDAGATLVDHRWVVVAGQPAREVALLGRESGQLTIGRIFLAGDRLFTMLGSAPRSEDATRDIRRFLASFEIEEP